MQSKLTKPWGPYAIGTVVADNSAEAREKPGAIHVNPERYAKLHESGFFAAKEPARPIPTEVKTSGEERAVKAPNALEEAREILARKPDLEAAEPDLAAAIKKEP